MQNGIATSRGFTMVELMMAVLIIGILAAIALPQYNEYTLKGKLSEGMSLLSDLQIRQEQYYQDNRTYANGMTPRSAGQVFTNVSCAYRSGDTQTYTCTATAPLINYTYTVTETGAKTTTPPSGTVANCWLRGSSGTC